jgi:hypothetical protein
MTIPRLALVSAWAALLLASAHAKDACPEGGVRAPLAAVHLKGKVIGPAPAAEVERQTRIAEARTGGHVSPDFAALPRVLVAYVEGGARHETIAAVLEGPIPAPGEIVDLASRYRDPRDPCAFIPWTVKPAGTNV